MCGLAGLVTNSTKINIFACLTTAENIQRHRGPDMQAKKIIATDNWQIGFAHQRLSILDLSIAGAQPMQSATANSCIIYNGEVYNYREIKSYLALNAYQSNTDTEVVINSLEELGIKQALPKFNGMWAFVWFNQLTKRLYLCRDRVGVKPLYYYLNDNTLYFASEVKTILEVSQDYFSLDYQAVGEYLLQSLQDTSNNSFYNEIKAVPAGHYIEIDLNKANLELQIHQYWDVMNAQLVTGTDLIEHVQYLFDDAVRLRMRSDVPVGVTLSGGLDSSSIAAAMKKDLGNSDNLYILSATSPGSLLDESPFIDIMAQSLDAAIHKVEFNWTASQAIELLKTTTWYNDAPIGSFSNVGHYLMMKKAHELGITVILSGQGADEILCGYKKYLGFFLQSLWREKKLVTASLILLGFLLKRSIINQFSWNEAARYLPKSFIKTNIDISGPNLKQHYQAQVLGLKNKQTMQQRQAADLNQFSVPFLTHYEDRMSMAWSREIRLPFLDYRLMELFINLPTIKKINHGTTKLILRQAMDSMLPQQITWRKDKQGFVNPQEDWLRNELVEQILHYFSEGALIFKLGLVNRNALLAKYKNYCSPRQKNVWYREIFNPLALEIWLQLNKKYLTNHGNF